VVCNAGFEVWPGGGPGALAYAESVSIPLRRIAAATPATPITSSTTTRAVRRGQIREREKDGSGTIGLLSSPAA
jgi:hypothetical protein